MVVESLKITNLFGYYSYLIDFKVTDSLFILTGLNGSGKTTIMRVFDNLSKGKLDYFYYLPFDEIEIELSNNLDPSDENVFIFIESKQDKLNKKNKIGKINSPDENERPDKVISFKWYRGKANNRKLISKIELRKQNADLNSLYISFSSLSFSNLKESNFPEIDRRKFDISEGKNNKISFSLLLSSLKIKFVEAQRLLFFSNKDGDKPKVQPTIKEVQEKLQEHLRHARYDFLSESQKRSNSLIGNLLQEHIDKLSVEEYNKYREELLFKVTELKEYGIANETILPYNDSKKEILSIYIRDQKAKIDLFETELSHLRLFSKLLEKKHFSHKKITFSPQYGLRATSDNKDIIELDKLSSGEQNEIIMLYELIFDITRDTVLLIDEPEISLHVIWQEEFMEDLLEISKIRKQQIIVATHSPQIIGERWKTCFDLTENNKKS